MRHLIAFFILVICTAFSYDNTPLADQYIGQYKAIAVSEMQRTGIPASIKLAQGLLESDWGRSDLATVGNNHFGIKCGSTWTGKTYYKEDDDRNQKGELIASCFRSFEDPYLSYIAHSDFLTRNNKQSRYGFLFELPADDYRAWAKGLQKSGYATDPNYPKKLITIIEKYELYRFDQESTGYASASTATKAKVKQTTSTTRKNNPKTRSNRTEVNAELNHESLEINGVNAIRIAQAISLKELSKTYKKHTSSLIRNNYFITDKDQIIPANSIVYLSRKPSKYDGNIEEHQVAAEEDIPTIAHQYGVSESYLRRINKLKKGDVLEKDLTLHLVKPKRKTAPKRRKKTSSRKSKKTENGEEYLFEKGWAKG